MFIRLPACLRQTLAVYGCMRRHGLSRGRAAAKIAEDEGVGESTVRSAVTRGLGVTSREFDLLARAGNETGFHAFLVGRFPEFAVEIASAFKNMPTCRPEARQSLLHERIARELTGWSQHAELPLDVRRSMAELAEKVLNHNTR